MVRPVVYLTCSVSDKKMHGKVIKYNMHRDEHDIITMKNVNFRDTLTVQVKEYLFVMENNA